VTGGLRATRESRMSVIQQAVTEDEAEIRLDRWLRRHFPVLTQGMIQKLCRTGQIRVDGKRVEAATRLDAGQTVRIPPLPEGPPPAPPPAPLDSATERELQDMILYMDDSLIAVNKPHGLPVQGGPGITRHLDAMMDGFRQGALDKPRLVHRIDMDTSGLLLFARTPGMAAKMAAAFRGRDVQKTYWAVVSGRPPRQEGCAAANAWPRPRKARRVPPSPSPNFWCATPPPARWPGSSFPR
jgi:23S rRNA pseudouridine955/2504/2580 synthase